MIRLSEKDGKLTVPFPISETEKIDIELTPDFHVPKRRRLRGTLFLTPGPSAGIPVVHLILFGNHVTGFSGYETTPKYYLWVLGGASYVVGP